MTDGWWGCAEGLCRRVRSRKGSCPTVRSNGAAPAPSACEENHLFFLFSASGRDESLAAERIFIFFMLFDMFINKDHKNTSPELKWLFKKPLKTRGMLTVLKILGFVENGQKWQKTHFYQVIHLVKNHWKTHIFSNFAKNRKNPKMKIQNEKIQNEKIQNKIINIFIRR